jgi:hypothetical protein
VIPASSDLLRDSTRPLKHVFTRARPQAAPLCGRRSGGVQRNRLAVAALILILMTLFGGIVTTTRAAPRLRPGPPSDPALTKLTCKTRDSACSRRRCFLRCEVLAEECRRLPPRVFGCVPVVVCAGVVVEGMTRAFIDMKAERFLQLLEPEDHRENTAGEIAVQFRVNGQDRCAQRR